MAKDGVINNQVLAIGIVLMLILVVYSVTSTINIAIENDPMECNDTSFVIKNVCFSNNRTSLSNFHTSVNILIQNKDTDINGFTVRIFGEKNIEPAVIFSTVPNHEQKLVSVAYEKDVAGNIKKIELKPMLNLDQNIYHCSLRHGMIYDGKISSC